MRHNDFVYNPMRANIGSIGVVPEELDGSLASPDYVVFRSKTLKPEFLLSLLRSPFYRMYIDVVSTGSIRDRLYFSELKKMRLPQTNSLEQIVVSERARRTEQELQRLQDESLEKKSKSIELLHSLIDVSGAYGGGRADGASAFRALADQWYRETGRYSSISKKVKHPAYRRIVAMGEAAVPLILRELRNKPTHWFAALGEITRASPVRHGEAVDVKGAAAAWRKWGKEHGYLDK